jgi:hypothetical protein
MLGVGGFGATGAPGAAGGASEALRVTRTVSFLSGMVEVCLEAGIDEVARGAGIDEVDRGGGISFSLISRRFLDCEVGKGNQPPADLSNLHLASGQKGGIFPCFRAKSAFRPDFPARLKANPSLPVVPVISWRNSEILGWMKNPESSTT